MNHTQGCKLFTLITLFVGVLVVGPAAAHRWSDWSEAVPVTEINTPTAGEGCAIESPNGLNLYIASNRPGGLGGNDIWVAERDSINEPWGSVQNLGSPVNSVANDFCPTPLPGHWLFFVSERPGPNTCNAGPGKGDIYLIRKNPAHGWGEPLNLGCVADGTDPNSIGAEFSPSFVETSAGAFLYFSSDGGSDGGAQVSHDTLRRGGDLVAIEPRVLDVLIYLLINRERVITKDELLDKFWPGQVVSETALTRCIVAARKAVGDDGAKQAIIETQRGRGYRFIAPVATIAAPVLSAESRVPSQSEEVSRKEAEANQKAKEENGLKSSVQSLASEDHKRIVTSHPLDPRPVTLDNAAPARSWSIRPLLLIGLLLLVGIITAVQYLSLPTLNPNPPIANPQPPLPLPDKPSIVVIPFTNLSGDPGQEYFSDGLTDGIITELSRIPQLFVIARQSAFTYKGKQMRVQEIGREVGVQYVLEGSVQQVTGRLRILAQLSDATTGEQLWAERYDLELSDTMTVQEQIRQRIAMLRKSGLKAVN